MEDEGEREGKRKGTGGGGEGMENMAKGEGVVRIREER